MLTPLTCIAIAIYFEARGESIEGQQMVAATIINRMNHPQFPDTACGVVKQRKQFSFYSDGRSDKPTEPEAYLTASRIASEALKEGVVNETSLYFHSTAVQPIWRHKLKRIGKIGNHVFYADNKEN
jgi:N-acetylmuramoyl-L-alanine amidase